MDKKLSWSTVKMKIGDLVEWDKNPVKLSDKEAADIARSLDKFGLVIPFVANAPLEDGKADLIDGHQRKKVHFANLNGGDAVEVDVRIPSRPLSEKEREELVIRLRKNTGEFDTALLQSFEATDLAEWGFTAKELNEIGFANESMDAEPQIDRAEELREKWGVELGQMWQLGEHRIICGDCTDAAVVARVMGGEKADMVFTSPPYNQGNSKGDLFSHGKRVENLYKHSEDNMSDEDYKEFIFSVLDIISNFISDVHSVVWNVAYNAKSRNLYGKIIFSKKNPFSVLETIVWDKGGSVNLPNVGIYSRRCEFVFVMSLGEKYLTSQTYGNPRWNYWKTKKINQLDGHKATFSLEFAERGISELSVLDSVIFEPFCGSGTCIIAAENLGRRCRAVEISPAYVAVTLERMAEAFPALLIQRVDDD